MDRSLLLFAKVPRAGEVKTRLTPVLTAVESARLYSAFLKDALRRFVRLEADLRLYLAPPLPNGMEGVPSEVTVLEQEGPSLAARMQNAFRETFEAGYDTVVITGADHPTLPTSFVRQSFTVLDPRRSICLGPSEDGGFYLLGMNAFYPQPFEDMTYSHPHVFDETIKRIGWTDARLTVLPRWYDVDTPETLRRLLADLESEDIDAPNTRRVIDRLGLESIE